MLRQISAMGLISIVSLAGCRLSSAESAGPTASPESNTPTPVVSETAQESPVAPTRFELDGTVIEIEIVFPNPVSSKDDSLDFIVKATNVGVKRVGMFMPPRDVVPSTIDDQGSTVWPPEFNGMTQLILLPGTEFEPGPGGIHEWTVTWDLMNQNGDRVWPGDYHVQLDVDRLKYG